MERTVAGEVTAAGETGVRQRTEAPVGALWAGALIVAGLGTAIGFEAEPGVNWGIWTTLAGLGLYAVAAWRARSQRAPGVDRVAAWCVALAAVVAWGSAVTANDLVQFLTFITCVVLLATATRVVGGTSGNAVGAGVLVVAPLAGFGATAVEAGRRAAETVGALRGERAARVGRGLAIALPVAGVFALLLAGADPLLSSWRRALFDVLGRLEFVPRAVFFLGLGMITLGAYGLAVRGTSAGGVSRPALARAFRIGETDRRFVVGAVALVFGGFLAVQPAYLLADVSGRRIAGMTYAAYAHRGFVELTIAATLCVLLVVLLDHWGERARPSRGSRWGTLLLIAEVAVVLASAFQRLVTYEQAYGYTILRVHVQLYIVGVAIALVLLAREIIAPAGIDAPRFVRRAGMVAVLMLAGLAFTNPEAWVVRRNVARYRATGKIDVAYLASLSLDAVPAFLESMPLLPPACEQVGRYDLGVAHARAMERERARHWYEWNRGRVQGVAALAGAGIVSLPDANWAPGCGEGERPGNK